MSEVQWGIATQPNSFQNALAQGFQIGSVLRERKLQDEAQKHEAEGRNALAQYATSGQGFEQAVQYDPRSAMAVRGDLQGQQEAQRKQYQEQMGTFRKLLIHAKTNPQEALAAAQQMGLDIQGVPPANSPEFQPWVDQQLFVAEALEKADPNELKGIAYELEMAGYQPGTPEFQEAARSVISNKYATEYVDENGNTRRRSALNLEGSGGGSSPPDAAVAELRSNPGTAAQFDEIFGQGAAARVLGNGGPGATPGNFPAGY